MELKTLTIVMAAYGQPRMLQRWFDTVAEYDDVSRSQVRMIVIDDHGDPPVTPPEAPPCPLKVYRIDDNIAWNQMGARNLGMHKAEGWCMMVDPDMIVDAGMIVRVLQRLETLKQGTLIKYGLRHRTGPQAGQVDMTSPNTYIIHRSNFFACGGYDEEYRGNKGWSDVQMLDVLNAFFTVKEDPGIWVQFYGRDEVEDAQVMSLDRSVKNNRALRIAKRDLAKKCGGWTKWAKKNKVRNLRFKWHKVYPTI